MFKPLIVDRTMNYFQRLKLFWILEAVNGQISIDKSHCGLQWSCLQGSSYLFTCLLTYLNRRQKLSRCDGMITAQTPFKQTHVMKAMQSVWWPCSISDLWVSCHPHAFIFTFWCMMMATFWWKYQCYWYTLVSPPPSQDMLSFQNSYSSSLCCY